MPGSTTVTHPSGQIKLTFTEADHRYVDEFDFEYTSGTKLVHNAFSPFDADAAAAVKSAKTGIPAEQLKAEWAETGRAASESGTRAHENCERQILGRYSEMNQPRDEEEKIRFRVAWAEVEHLRTVFTEVRPEMLVFSPRFKVAGSIDLLCKKDDMHYTMMDWKYIKGLEMKGFGGRTGIHPATRHLPDSNYWHYALQQNIYTQILKLEGYIPLTAEVDKWLLVYNWNRQAFDYAHLPELTQESLMLIAWNAVPDDGLNPIPF